MKKLIVFGALVALLSACVTQPSVPVQMRVSDDARILNGAWSGTLAEDYRLGSVTSGGGWVYAIRGWSSGRVEVVAFKLLGGQVERVAALPVGSLAYREDGALLATDATDLLELDPVTLAVTARHPGVRGELSADGGAVVGAATRTDTRTLVRTPLALTSSHQERSSDGHWVVDGDASAVKLDSGARLDLGAKHPNTCGVTGGRPVTAIETVGDQLAVGYADGFVELRGPDGQVGRLLFPQAGCDLGIADLRRVGAKLLVRLGDRADRPARLVLLDPVSGASTDQTSVAPDPGHHNLTAAGSVSLINDGPSAVPPAPGSAAPSALNLLLRFTPLDAPAWTVQAAPALATLTARARYRDAETYRSEGTLSFGGRALTFSALAKVEFGLPPIRFTQSVRTQNVAPSTVTYAADLTDPQGQVAGQLTGWHGSGPAEQRLRMTDARDGHVYSGSLKRP